MTDVRARKDLAPLFMPRSIAIVGCSPVSSGKLGSWPVHNGSKPVAVPKMEVRRGDVIDLVVDPGKTTSFDSFTWIPEFTLVDAPTNQKWNYQKEFNGPVAPTMTPWELAAQVLLMSNEFMFVD